MYNSSFLLAQGSWLTPGRGRGKVWIYLLFPELPSVHDRLKMIFCSYLLASQPNCPANCPSPAKLILKLNSMFEFPPTEIFWKFNSTTVLLRLPEGNSYQLFWSKDWFHLLFYFKDPDPDDVILLPITLLSAQSAASKNTECQRLWALRNVSAGTWLPLASGHSAHVHRRLLLFHLKSDIPICRALITRTNFDCVVLTFPLRVTATNTNVQHTAGQTHGVMGE